MWTTPIILYYSSIHSMFVSQQISINIININMINGYKQQWLSIIDFLRISKSQLSNKYYQHKRDREQVNAMKHMVLLL